MKKNSLSLGKNMGLGGFILALFAIVASGLVALTFENTKERIAENEKDFLLKSLHVLIPPIRHNNDLYSDRIQRYEKTLAYRDRPITIYRARMNGEPVAAILSVTAPDGYGGPIKLLVAINFSDETLAGARVVSHKETPGLGDVIEAEKSDWIYLFDGKSLRDPPERQWAVKKDGGEFDQLTGATITPRALVKIVYKSLKYFRRHKGEIFFSEHETVIQLNDQ